MGTDVQTSFFWNGCPIQRHFNTSIWSGVRPHMNLLLDNNISIVGTIEKIHFWKDNWLGAHLAELFAISPHSSFEGIIDYVIVNGHWNMPQYFMNRMEIASKGAKISLPLTPFLDKFVWFDASDGKLSAKHVFSFLHYMHVVVD